MGCRFSTIPFRSFSNPLPKILNYLILCKYMMLDWLLMRWSERLDCTIVQATLQSALYKKQVKVVPQRASQENKTTYRVSKKINNMTQLTFKQAYKEGSMLQVHPYQQHLVPALETMSKCKMYLKYFSFL